MVNPKPLGVAAIVIVVLLVVQPLTMTYSGISMNVIGSVVVAIGGISAGFADS